MYYTGIGLHMKTSSIATMDDQGKVQVRCNLSNRLPVIFNYSSSLARTTKVVIGSMGPGTGCTIP